MCNMQNTSIYNSKSILSFRHKMETSAEEVSGPLIRCFRMVSGETLPSAGQTLELFFRQVHYSTTVATW